MEEREKAYRQLVRWLIDNDGAPPDISAEGDWVNLFDEIMCEIEDEVNVL